MSPIELTWTAKNGYFYKLEATILSILKLFVSSLVFVLYRHSSPFLVVQAAKKLPRCLISPKHCQYFTDDLLLRLKG